MKEGKLARVAERAAVEVWTWEESIANAKLEELAMEEDTMARVVE